MPGWFAAGSALFAFLLYLVFWFAVVCLALAVVLVGTLLYFGGKGLTAATDGEHGPQIRRAGERVLGIPASIIRARSEAQGRVQ